jgi:hypothetical protein
MTKLIATLSWLVMLPLIGFGQQSTVSEQDRTVRINQIQVIGSHNSYHTGIAPSERKLIEQQNPKAMRALDYAHAPLADQLTGGVRQVEIDVYADSKGGRYSHPAIVGKVAEAGLPADPDFDPQHPSSSWSKPSKGAPEQRLHMDRSPSPPRPSTRSIAKSALSSLQLK